jgi:hypothetical protein
MRSDLAIVSCFWGEKHGAQLHKDGASIPSYASTRAPDALTDVDYEIALWALLYDDPLYELRLLSLQEAPSGGFAPNRETPYQQVDKVLNTLLSHAPLKKQLHECHLEEQWDEAIQQVRKSHEFRSALLKAPGISVEYRLAVARALVAQASLLAYRQQYGEALWMDGAERDVLVELLLDALGGRERGVMGWIKGYLASSVLRCVTTHVERRRGAILDATFPAAGDILLYQARGESIRGYIRDTIKQAPQPVILLAHSLGGIACVDLLILEAFPQVKLLVTVGSQSSFLYELDALSSLRFGEPLPAHFPHKWLNIYDLHDFLSYIAAGVFPGEARITDVKVDNKQPFPQSHSAYWSNKAVWEAINQRMP